MRALSFLIAVVVTLFAVWPAALLTADACVVEASPPMCSSSGCCRPEPAKEAPARPCDQQDEPCPCDPFLCCAACACPLPMAALRVSLLLPVLDKHHVPFLFALASPTLGEVWHPPNAMVALG